MNDLGGVWRGSFDVRSAWERPALISIKPAALPQETGLRSTYCKVTTLVGFTVVAERCFGAPVLNLVLRDWLSSALVSLGLE